MSQRPNQYDGKCACCGCHVPAGAGTCHTHQGRKEFGRWKYHTKDGRELGPVHRVTCAAHAADFNWPAASY